MSWLTGYRPRGVAAQSTYHEDADYMAVDIGGLLDVEALTQIVLQAVSRLPAAKQRFATGNWGYNIRAHTGNRKFEAVVVRPYPYKTWGW